MKIVKRNKFLQMPAGTVFSTYRPCVFGELLIKGDSCENDFYFQQIADAIESSGDTEYIDALFDAQENGTSLKMDFDCEGRDGDYNDNQLYAVWEKQDVEQLIARLRQCL